MIKINLIFLIYTTLFFIVPVSFAHAREKLTLEPPSIDKKGLYNPVVDIEPVSCYNNS